MASPPRARASALRVADCAGVGGTRCGGRHRPIIGLPLQARRSGMAATIGGFRRPSAGAGRRTDWYPRRRDPPLRRLRRRRHRWGDGGPPRSAGLEVAVIARGAHLAAIRERGLTLRTPEADTRVRVPAARSAGEIRWRDDDVALLAVKSQDTDGAIHDLAAAAPPSLVVVCAQNGVANERTALRRFGNTLGMLVICSATHLAPGVVEAESVPCPGSWTWGGSRRRRPRGRGGGRGTARRHLRLASGAGCDALEVRQAALQPRQRGRGGLRCAGGER